MHKICEKITLNEDVECLVCHRPNKNILINLDTGKWYCDDCDNLAGALINTRFFCRRCLKDNPPYTIHFGMIVCEDCFTGFRFDYGV